MIVGVLRESFQRERRVALVPTLVSTLVKAGAEVLVEAGAGAAAGFPDAEYEAKGARMVARPDVFSRADVILMVRTPGANPTAGAKDIAELLAQEQLGVPVIRAVRCRIRPKAEAGCTRRFLFLRGDKTLFAHALQDDVTALARALEIRPRRERGRPLDEAGDERALRQ